MSDEGATRFNAALQHGPRPLPLFLDMLRSETAASPARRQAALAGLTTYQHAPRAPRPAAPPVAATCGRARLLDYGGDGPAVVFVPSLINPSTILDLTPERSLLRWCATQGLHPYLVDWGEPTPEEAARDVGGHVRDLLLPLLDALPAPPLLVGYCLGGTMALAAAVLRPVAGLALIAAPWRFAGYGAAAREAIAALWAAAKPGAARLGLVPMEVLQTGFWRLDPARTIAKYEAFAALPPDSDAAAFVALEDWANAGAPLSYAAGAELFERFVAADLPGTGAWQVDGEVITPARLRCRAIEFVSLNDRIVPATTAADLPDRHDLGAGHVGMVVGSRAREQLWEPLAAWLHKQ